MKKYFLFIASCLLAAQFSFADIDETFLNVSKGFLSIAKSLGGHVVRCGTPGKKSKPEMATPVFALSMKVLSESSVHVKMTSLLKDKFHKVGFGGETLNIEESHYNADWVTLSIGDDGRATYFIQNPKQNNFADARCNPGGSTSANFFATKLIGMDGMVHSTAMNCCLE